MLLRFATVYSLALVASIKLATMSTAEVIVSEILASNRTVVADEAEQFDDWIELRNLSADAVQLGGMFLTDNPTERPRAWRIPDGTTLPGFGYLLIWADGHPEQGDQHANFSLSRNGGSVALIGEDGTSIVDQLDYGGQGVDISFGVPLDANDEPSFYPIATPGQPNITSSVSILAEVAASPAGGLFHGTVKVGLASAYDEGEIRYTLDGDAPGADSTLYENPIEADASVSVTAAVFLDGRRIGPVMSEVYIALADDVSNFSSNLPVAVVEGRGYRFDRNSSPTRKYPPQLVYATMHQPGEDGRTRLSGTQAANYAGRAGMNVRGASSREWPKKSYKFDTWDSVNRNRNVSLLGMPADNDWVLHAPYFDKTFLRNYLTYLWWERLGHTSVRTQFIELFVNMDGDPTVEMEDYVGVYLLMEKIKSGPERIDVTPLQPFHSEEPEISGGYVLQTTNIQQNFTTRRGTFMKYVSPRLEEMTSDQKRWIRGHLNDFESVLYGSTYDDPLEGYAAWIDVPSHVDYDVMREMTRNIDGASTFFSLDRGGKLKMGPLWDYNQALGMTSLFSRERGWETEGWNNVYMRELAHWAKWWDRLDTDPEYQIRWNDRWVELREGALATSVLTADIDAAATLLEEAQQRNYERWNVLGKSVWNSGSPREAPGYRDRDTYAKEVAWMRNWLIERLIWIDAQVPGPPDLAPGEGSVPTGTTVTLSAGSAFQPLEGTIYFTRDGSDPRTAEGEPSESAEIYSAPLEVADGTTHVAARVRSVDDQWGTLRNATYLTGAQPPALGDLALSELHFNPSTSELLEFIEVTNAGDQFVDLTGVALTDGVTFTFDALGLQPGESTVVVRDAEAFAESYDTEAGTVAGNYQGRLANGGETVTLSDATGVSLFTVTYDDSEPWPTAADGGGHSLELVRIDADPALTSSWRASANKGGSPGTIHGAFTFDAWATHYFGAPVSPGQDADADGASNALEFALASDPNSKASVPWIRATIAEDTMELKFRRFIAADVVYSCERSTDLLTWEPDPTCTLTASGDLDGMGVAPIEEATLTASAETDGFIRLSIQLRDQ